MKFINELNAPLFKNLSKEEVLTLFEYLEPLRKTYKKGQYIWHTGDSAQYLGIVSLGQVNIVKEDILGNRTVIADIKPSQIFGESFAISNKKTYPVSVQAAVDSTILLIEYKRLMGDHIYTLHFHSKMIRNLMILMAEKNIKLKSRIDCITHKSIKGKILYYLVDEMHLVEKNSITIPFNREELADYLGVNRSALSRELSNLKEEGLIYFHKNLFSIGHKNNLATLSDYLQN